MCAAFGESHLLLLLQLLRLMALVALAPAEGRVVFDDVDPADVYWDDWASRMHVGDQDAIDALALAWRKKGATTVALQRY
jgi:hypothetical protein